MHSLSLAPWHPHFADSVVTAVLRGLPHLLLATIAAGLVAFVAQSWISPRYLAEVHLTAAEAEGPRPSLRHHLQALSDPERLLAVAKELDLQRRADFAQAEQAIPLAAYLGFGTRADPALHGAEERLLAAIFRRLDVAVSGNRASIRVRFWASEPYLSSTFVNRLVEAYRRQPGQEMTPLAVATWAEPPAVPFYPRKGATAMVGMAATLLLGLLGILVREGVRSARRRLTSVRPGAVAPDRNVLDLLSSSRFAVTGDVAVAGQRLMSMSSTGRGLRTMVAGESPAIDATPEAMQLAQCLSAAGRTVVLIRWSLKGGDMNGRLSGTIAPGLNDLIRGDASFEDIITPLPDCSAHAIGAGSPCVDRLVGLDSDRLNLVLDTLDEVYDDIVVVAEHGEALSLFVALEGRFDACISVAGGVPAAEDLAAELDQFLGFAVADMVIVRVKRAQAGGVTRRILDPRAA